MAYEANRDDDLEKLRNDENNANNIRNAADVAIASGNPYAAAAGGAVKAADAITGGKASELGGKALTTANKYTPGGRMVQDASNKLNESGISDAAGTAASIKNRAQGAGDAPNQVKNNTNAGGEQNGSLPSSSDKNNVQGLAQGDTGERKKETVQETGGGSNAEEQPSDEEKKKTGVTGFLASTVAKMVLFMVAPFFLIILLLFAAVSGVAGIFGEFEDGFGISETVGEETGDLDFEPTSPEQQNFYDQVNAIKQQYMADGKDVDALNVVAVFHVLKRNEAKIDYEKISNRDIKEVVDAMFDEDGMYSKELFKSNLIQQIIPKYLPKTTATEREIIAEEMFSYVDDYYDLIGVQAKGSGSSCSMDSGTCEYDIKGYYISGKGNVKENVQMSNIYVRLMQCGKAGDTNYGGTFGKSLEGEDLVPFEKYILGVTYAGMGANAPAEAFKAQSIVARSYILARHADVGGWRSLKEENGRWILQAASCSADQIYCDPDKGCSSNSGGQVYSGLEHNGSFKMQPLAENSPLRSYAAATEGEVLTNSQGYVIYTGYSAAEKNQFDALARKGYDYKKILLQTYNQGTKKYGARDITKNSCTNNRNTSGCVASGDYASWKQYSGAWANVPMGSSGSTIQHIGCLVTAVAMQIARSGVQTNIPDFNPGTFVQFLNQHGGFASGGNFVWRAATQAAPAFQYRGQISVAGLSKTEKYNQIQSLVTTPGVYVLAEVKGRTGQHWVAIDSVDNGAVHMMDPGSNSTDMWGKYNWANTSTLVYYQVG